MHAVQSAGDAAAFAPASMPSVRGPASVRMVAAAPAAGECPGTGGGGGHGLPGAGGAAGRGGGGGGADWENERSPGRLARGFFKMNQEDGKNINLTKPKKKKKKKYQWTRRRLQLNPLKNNKKIKRMKCISKLET